MKERKDTLPEKKNKQGKGNKLIIALLSACLIMTSLPNMYYQTFVLAAELPNENEQYEILSVSELPMDVKSQTVSVGTPIEALNLPGTLTVSCCQHRAENQEAPVEPENQKAPVEPENQETQMEPENIVSEDTEVIPDVIIEGIIWESKPEYDMEQDGTYIFTPVLPDGYLLSEGMELPEIVVDVEGDTLEGRFREIDDFGDGRANRYFGKETDIFDGGEEADSSFVKEEKEISNAEEERDILYAEEEEAIFADEDTETIRIAAGQSETWKERTLNNATVIVEENAVLTITEFVTINGNVTITGGGLIQRGGADACLNVQASGNLTLENITVDGGSIHANICMLMVLSGKLTLGDGCVIQNCAKSGDGGAIYLNQANAVLNKATIKNCTASSSGSEFSFGGAMYIYASIVDINGTRFENCSVGQGAGNDQGGALYIYNGCEVDMDGAVFQGCSARGSGEKSAGGAFYADSDNTINIRDTVMEDCSAGTQGGAFLSFHKNVVNIYSGTFRNNRTTSISGVHGNVGGGCIYNCRGILNIYGGSFLNNYAVNKGGCLNHCWEEGTVTNITGGIFEGNYCDYKDAVSDYSGSGGIFNSSVLAGGQAELNVSGNVKFGGEGKEESGVDGIYLDQHSGVLRKIFISTTLTYPVNLYLKAAEGYVIAESSAGYTFLHERDMKKIKFIDIGNSGKTWYAKLSDDRTQVILTETNPGYKYFVYYISNGAAGNIVDDNQYSEGDMAVVKSNKDEQGQDILTYEGRTFLGWSKNQDGSGKLYQAGESLGEMTDDVNLYAVFAENLAADFYSGSPGSKVKKEGVIEAGGKCKINAPELEDLNDPQHLDEMEGWIKAGWAREEEEFDVANQPGDEILLENHQQYCGIYEKDVTLTYDKNGWDISLDPATDIEPSYARVHEEVTYQPAEFVIAADPSYKDLQFIGWNTEPDGSGKVYHAGDTLTSETDLTLYAIFTKSFRADFYSGAAGQKETKEASAGQTWTQSIEAPQLKDMEGWDKIGWAEDENQFRADFAAGEELILTKHSSYYGIYRKDVILSYDLNGGVGEQEPMANSCYANVHSEVGYQPAKFTVAQKAERDGYVFVGWNTEKDGTGKNYQEGEEISLTENQTLYARWVIARADYRVEHYKQELNGGYLLDVSEEAEAVVGDEVRAKAKTYTGFTENTVHEMRIESGIVAADGSLILRLYYDRDIYKINFDLNGAEGEVPGSQSIPYGGYADKVAEPERRGYHFKGWFTDDQGMEENRWDFDTRVEENCPKDTADQNGIYEVTLYARWVDETAPVLEEISFSRGYVNLRNWIIRKKNLVITVPIFEEGSGVKQLDYKVSAAGGASRQESSEDGMALLQSNEKAAAGIIEIPESRKGRNLFYGVLTPNQGEFSAGKIQLLMKGGQIFAKITVSEDFKGNIGLTCMDNAGNVSSGKTIAARGGGVIVEDNAPEIEFSSRDGKLSQTFTHDVDVRVKVEDDVDSSGEERIAGGIAAVTYQLDKGREISVPEEEFTGDIVESYEFEVEVSGAGKHVLRVTAVDHAGNTNTRRAQVDIGHKTVETPRQLPTAKTPTGSEPKTGDSMNVQVYATLAMVAGLSYLLLYFVDNSGITEREKEELVSRILRWAKRGGIARRLLSFVALFFFLLYYHSIGKSADVEWNMDDVWQ